MTLSLSQRLLRSFGRDGVWAARTFGSITPAAGFRESKAGRVSGTHTLETLSS